MVAQSDEKMPMRPALMISAARRNCAPFAMQLIAALALVLCLTVNGAIAENVSPKTELVTIDLGGENSGARSIVLGLNKAAIVEIPADVKDVLVSNPGIVDAIVRTPRRIYLLGIEVGETNAFFFDAKGRQLLNLEIRVERDLTQLNELLHRHLPGARIHVEAINDNIVLSGSVRNVSQSNRARKISEGFIKDAAFGEGRALEDYVINMLSIEGGEQVMLKVRIAEMQRTLAKQLGVDLAAIFDAGNVEMALGTSNPLSVVGNALSANSASSAVYTDPGSGSVVGGLVRYLERNGLIRTLAEPTLTAISGESAQFLAGGEFPVPASRDREGNVLVVFRPFGVALAFTPIVLDEGNISLKISTEVSELTTEGAFLFEGNGAVVDEGGNVTTVSGGLNVPALRVRRAETTVELPSGGSMVLAGLIQESTKENLNGVPGMKNVPVLGALFRSRDFQNSETELVIIVTPYLVKPASEQDFALPTDGFGPASDFDSIMYGRLNKAYGMGQQASADASLNGSVGFILD